MTTEHRVYPGLYKDSVALMAITSTLTSREGIEAASVVMATEANRANLVRVGLSDDGSAGPNDLLVAVKGTSESCEEALEDADRLLTGQDESKRGSATEAPVPTSTRTAVRADASANLALIAVPGQYAAAEALKALSAGLDVMIFSDNVPVEQELEAKQYARDRGLLVMGADCGTAIVDGIPLGFANVVRRGSIGVVGASGTGMQEITCRIHQLGAGVSQALGTGGHDLSEDIGGISTVQALRSLDEDAATDVIVLVSKPPAEQVALTVLGLARSLSTPVVVMFVGATPDMTDEVNMYSATTLAESAEIAVAISRGESTDPSEVSEVPEEIRSARKALTSSQQYLRGIFSGGTFAYEAQALCQEQGIRAHSNTPIANNLPLEDVWTSDGHTIIDVGDDVFTRGRPHPMIDPSQRDERVAAELEDPATAVLLFDVVLGYGASENPVTGLLKVLERGRDRATSDGRSVAVIAHVCGTDQDPQDRNAVIRDLRNIGVLVADSNAQAARWAASVVSKDTGSAGRN